MSTISTELRASDDPTSDVAGLLAHGALVIKDSREARDRSRQARVDATWLKQRTHALSVGSNPHSHQPIPGGRTSITTKRGFAVSCARSPRSGRPRPS